MACVLTAIAGAVAGVGLSGAVESWLFYFPSRRVFKDAPGAEAVTFKTPDNLRLSAWFFPAKSPVPQDAAESTAASDDPATQAAIEAATQLAAQNNTAPAPGTSSQSLLSSGVQGSGDSTSSAITPRPTILVAHGNAGCLPDHDEFCAFLADHGFNVLLFDYRGYGRSDLPTRGLNRTDLVADARAAFDYLLTRPDVDPDRIGLLGYSLGGNIGLGFTVGEPRIRAVVTLATFARWKEVASDHGGALGRYLIPEGMDAVESVASLGDRPYMIVHGDQDDIVPFRHAGLLETAANNAGVTVTRLDVPGADHLNMTASKEVQRSIADFFTTALAAPSSADQPPSPAPPSPPNHP